jgi:hypothetical protein
MTLLILVDNNFLEENIAPSHHFYSEEGSNIFLGDVGTRISDCTERNPRRNH